MENNFKFQKWSNMDVKVHHRAERIVEHHLIRGRAVLNPEDSEFVFVENEPRLARSKEVGRTAHSRFVRRPDGNYTITLRINPLEKYLHSVLQAEVREVVAAISDDYKKHQAEMEAAQRAEEKGKTKSKGGKQ